MADPSMLPQALDAFTRAVAQREGTHFRAAILFGSHARGRPGDAFDAVRDLGAVAYDVLLETGVLIQPLPVPGEWQSVVTTPPHE